MTTFNVHAENYSMQVAVTVIGRDLLLTITGGDTPHIGTVTTLSATEKITTVQFGSHDGRLHKDNVLAEIVAEKIRSALPGKCVITSGVHVNGITKAQILAASVMAKKLGEQVLDWLQATPFTAAPPIYRQKK